MEHEDPKDMMNALNDVMKSFHGVAAMDTNAVRIDLHEKLIARSMMLAVGGIMASFFMSIQAVFLILQLTGDIDWSWWVIFIPTVLFATMWYLLNWVRKQKAEKMIDEMQRSIDEIKKVFSDKRAEQDEETIRDIVADIQGKSKEGSA